MGQVPDEGWMETDRPGESLAFRKPLPGMSLLSGRGSDRCWVEYHSEFKICLLGRSSDASVSYQCRGTHKALPGELMLFEPGDHHITTRVDGRAAFDVVGLETGELERAAEELGLRGSPHFRAAHLTPSKEVAGALERLVASTAAGASRLELECLQARFLQLLLKDCGEAPVPHRRRDFVAHAGVRAAREHLRHNFQEEPRLADLARIAGLSHFAFAHAFKRYVGMPPYAYFQMRRASEARRLVEKGAPIAAIAEQLGYTDVPLLTRTIKAHFGAPPARWRKNLPHGEPLSDL